MIHLDLKPQDEDFGPISVAQNADIDEMERILATLGYDAPRLVLAKAWERYSTDYHCISWLPIGMLTDHDIAGYLLEQLEPCTTQD